MRVERLQISKFMGVEELEYAPGKVTVISGDNGQGKSSVLKAIQVALGGGGAAKLIRQGEKSGKVVLVFDDGSEINTTLRPSGNDYELTHPSGVTGGRHAIDSLVAHTSLNPVELLTAKPKDQVAMVRRAVPQPLDVEAVSVALHGDWWMEHVKEGDSTDDTLQRVEKHIYERRTKHNTALEEKEATIKSLSKSLPASGEPEVVIDQTEELRKLEAEEQEFLRLVNQAELESLTESDQHWDAEIARINEQLMAAQNAKREARAKIRTDAETARSKRMLANEQRRTELAESVAKFQAARDAWSRAENTRAIIDQMKQEAVALRSKGEKCTSMIEYLRAERKKTAELPIKGLEIRDGELYVDNLPFSVVNTARQVQIAIQVARHGAGTIPVICVDGLELMGDKMFAAFVKAAQQWPDLQFFVTRRTSGPLQVQDASDFALNG